MEPGDRSRTAAGCESVHADVIWAKVPRLADAAGACGRPAPYNAIGPGTQGDAAAPDIDFDLSHLLP